MHDMIDSPVSRGVQIQTQRGVFFHCDSEDDVPKCASTATPFAMFGLMLDQLYIPGLRAGTLARSIPVEFWRVSLGLLITVGLCGGAYSSCWC